jgi:2-methylcitrate dehydratase PrpD
MEPEVSLARFVSSAPLASFPEDVLTVVKRVVLATLGTAVAGAGEEGCGTLRKMLVARGGAPEATTFVFHDRLPAPSAALLNGTMCRALDFCDAMAPGLHIGSSLVPAVFAAMELRGGCSGEEFLTALAVGCEVGSRLNLDEPEYNGFDPTGVAGVFAAAAGAARMLRLNPNQTLHALALAFNRAGASFQSNVDGSLAVRLIQGWVAESGIECALLAREGFTGPRRFLSGIYGYAHLYARGRRAPQSFVADLGKNFLAKNVVFKKYPSCGVTQGATELALAALRELSLRPELIEQVKVALPPYSYKLVGHDFAIGDNPRVNAQFSVQYCVANALVRGSSKLTHFRESEIRNPEVLNLVKRVSVRSAPEMDARGHSSVDVTIVTKDGRTKEQRLDISPGFPGAELTAREHLARFRDCMEYAAYPLPRAQADMLVVMVEDLAVQRDVREMLQLMKAPSPGIDALERAAAAAQ